MNTTSRLFSLLFAIRHSLFALAFLGVAAPVGPASAAVCHPRERLAAELQRAWGEELRARAAAGGALVEVFVNAATTTFTILTVGADGTACIRAAGEGWTEYEAQEEGRGS